jgi:hemerythrin-like domain-containing protein
VDWLETYNISHHRKEEKVLDLLQDKGLANGELGRFWEDHEQGELVFEHLGEALEDLRRGEGERAKIKHMIEVLLLRYREHMDGEDELLFPAARMAIAKEDRERLLAEFAEIDRNMFRLSSQLRLQALATAIVGEVPPAEPS